MGILCTIVVLILQLYRQPIVGHYLSYGTLDGQQLSKVWPQLNNSEAFLGEIYQINIAPSNLSHFGIQFTVSKVGSQDLPRWLAYEKDDFLLKGLPLDSDLGVIQLFIWAMRVNETTSNSEFLGIQTFEINVVSERRNRSSCQQGERFMLVYFQLEVNAALLNSTQRIELYQGFTRTFEVSKTSSIFFQNELQTRKNTSTGCQVVREYESMSRGGAMLAIYWMIGCGLNSTLNDTANKVDNITNTLGGTISGYPIISWRILSGTDPERCFISIDNSSTSSSYVSSYSIYSSYTQSSLTPTEASSVSRVVSLLSSFSSVVPLNRSLSVYFHSTTTGVSLIPVTPLSPYVITASSNSPSVLTTAARLLIEVTPSLSSPRLTDLPNVSSSVVPSGSHFLLPSASTQNSTKTLHTLTSERTLSFVLSTKSLTLLTSQIPRNLTSMTSQISRNVISMTSQIPRNLASMTSQISRNVISVTSQIPRNLTSMTSQIPRNLISMTSQISRKPTSMTSQTPGNVTSMTSQISRNAISVTSQITPTSQIPLTSQIPPSPQNSNPIVSRPLPKLNITSCEYVFLEIPDDTFYDKEDGGTRNLTLRLLTKDFRELPSDSWITFDASRDVIYGVPLTTQLLKNSESSNFEYMLSAVDSGGRSVNTTVSIVIYDDPYPVGQRISIKADAYLKPSSLIPLELIRLVSGYLYDGDQRTINVLNLTVVSGNPSKVQMTWSDCKIVQEVCDVTRLERISKLVSISGSFVNPQFMIALMPKFVLRDVKEEILGMCLNEPPLTTRNVLLLNVTCCEKFQFDILPDLFYDKEDGNGRNLSLSLRFPNGSRLGSDAWINLNDTSQIIEGVVTLDHAQTIPANISEKFLLVATDSGKLETNISIHVIIQHPLPSSNYHVTLILKLLTNPYLIRLREIFLIIQKLKLYFGNKSWNNIRVLSFRQQDLVSIFTWANASLHYKPCDLDTIANISAKLKDDNGHVRDGFKSSMQPQYEVQFIFEEKLGHCKDGANERPKVLQPVLWLRLNQSLTYFEYKIPVNTFHDLEDGDTRTLKLSLLTTSFDPIPQKSWIVLNTEKQLIYGLPNEAANQAQPSGGFRYLLVAQDSGGKIASSILRVQLPGVVRHYSYLVTTRVRSYLDASLPCIDHVIKFLEKSSAFTGEDTSVRVVSYNITKTYPADVTISWTNLTGSFNRCDHEIIERNFRMFSDKEGRATKEFSDALLPYFIVQKINLKLFGVCDNLLNHSPVVLTAVPVINITIYRVFEFQLPEKMFYDKEDGFTRNLTVNVFDENDSKALGLMAWINFNTSSQLLYGIPTRTVAKQQPFGGYVIKLVAIDSDGSTVNTTTRIKVQNTKESFLLNYEIKIRISVNNSDESLVVNQILNFFSKLKFYLKNGEDLLLTNYTKENSILEVSFSSLDFYGNECDFSEIRTLREYLVCQSDQMNDNSTKSNVDGGKNSNSSRNMVNSQPSVNFTKEMAPDFVVIWVTGEKKGPCLNTAPIVTKPLPFFTVSSYGLFSIPLLPETFYDAEDGFTLNLSLVLQSSLGKALPPDSWLQLNHTTNELYGVITDQVILEQPKGNYSFLLVAKDVYGLQANTSVKIDVPGTLLDVGLKLNMILKNNYSSIVPQLDIMKQLLTKMVAYFDDNSTSFVNVISFQRGFGIPSTDILSWSNTTLDSMDCDHQALSDILIKVKQRDNQPNSALKLALQPEFELLLIFVQKLGSCEDRHNTVPRVLVSILDLNISIIPSVFRYTVPRNTFHDAEDGDTRNLTLSLSGVDTHAVPQNSSVQLNVPLQVIYGIFTSRDLNSENRVKTFVLAGKDSGGKSASTILRISLGNQTVSYNYQLNVIFNSYLSPSLPDVAHLIKFQEKLRTFPAMRDTQLASYSRASGYPARFEATFINASTTRIHTIETTCDYDEITRTSDTFRDASGDLKNRFITSFLPEFLVDDVAVQKFGPCKVLRNDPPKVNRRIPTINISVCETLKYRIAPDTFLDKEDGDTRNLTLELQTESTSPTQTNVSWIYLEVPSQILYAIPSVDIARYQPPDGYKFKIIAMDSSGALAETPVTVFVQDRILVDSYRLTASARIPAVFSNSKTILSAIQFTEAIQRYLSGSVSERMRVINFHKMSSSELEVTWSNCSLGYTPCDYEKIESIRKMAIYQKGLPQPKFIQFLAPEFVLASVVEELRGPCLNKGPIAGRELNPLNATLCERLRYTIPAETFYDSEDGYTANLSLSLFHTNSKSLGQDFWLTFNKSSQTILGYPNVDVARSQPESGYEFILNAKDRNGLSTNLGIKVIYDRIVPQSTYEVTLVLQAQFKTLPNSVEQLRIILDKLSGYTNGEKESIRVHSFVRAKPSSTVSFLTWSNCTSPANSCDVLTISETSKKLKNSDGTILKKFEEIFLPEFKLRFVFEQRLGACLEDTNFPPRATQGLQPLIIRNVCGFWEYGIPPGLFYDKEEGYTRNLTLSIKTNDFREVTATSWIQMDSTQTLYGFPQFRTPENSSLETFALMAADKQGKFGTTSLETIFKTKAQYNHFEITVEMLSYLDENFPDVYHLRNFLKKLASFLNLGVGSIKVVKYERTVLGSGSRFLVTWTNCSSSRNACNHHQIQLLYEKLNLGVGYTFFQSMLPFFLPTNVALRKFGPCKDLPTNSPPGLLRPIGKITVFSGSLLWYKIPRNTFFDDEDGNQSNLSLMLQFSNKTIIPPYYWLKFENVSYAISGVLITEHSWNHSFRLVARDRHGNEGNDVFEVVVEHKCMKLNYRVSTVVEFPGSVENAKSEFLRKLDSYFQPWLTDRNFTLIEIYKMSESNNIFNITWSHMGTCGVCDQVNSTVHALSQRVISNGTTREEFTKALAPEFGLLNASETICIAGTGSQVGVTVITSGQNDRWLLYIVPIATIAIFFLLCFLFFVFRGFVSRYKGKRDDVILDEHPSPARASPREILVVNSRETPLYSSDTQPLTVVNEGFLGSGNLASETPEILLDKRVSPSKASLRHGLSPIPEQVEPRVIETPLYSEAVLQLAAESTPGPGRRVPSPTTRIEMKELPVLTRTEIPVLGAPIPVARQALSYESEIDGRRNSRSQNEVPSPLYKNREEIRNSKEKIQASRSSSLESDSLDVYGKEDKWSIFDEEDARVPVVGNLRLPTPPDVGMLRLPPVPKALGNSPTSSLVNTPDRDSQSPSPFQTPLFTSTPAHSVSTLNSTNDVRQLTPSQVSVGFPGHAQYNSPGNPNYPLGIPHDTTSPPSYMTALEDRSHLGLQSPIGFPPPRDLVPYVDHRLRAQGPVAGPPAAPNGMTSQNDLHQVLGQLRETMNKELDRRNEVDKYLDFYMNKK